MNPSQSNMLSKEFMEQIHDILESEELSDCNFLVGPEHDQQLIASYKLILATVSPVFRAMFYGSLAEKIDPIPMPDVHPAHFNILLSYIYTNEIKLSSLEEASGVYYCAKKFLLPHLQQLCSEFFLSEVDSSNACQVYEYAQLFEDNKIIDKANEIMTDATKLVLNDPNFEEAKSSTLLHIFSLDRLCIDSEMDLLEAAERYIKARMKLATQNERAVKKELSIHQAIEKIRFLTVTPKQFAECQAREFLLSESEVLPILMNLVSNNTNVPYPSRLCQSRESRVQKNMSKTFSFTIKDIRNLHNHNDLYSTRNYTCDFCWRLLVRAEPFPYNDESKEKYLGVYLEWYLNTKSSNWKCLVEMELTLLSHTSSSLNHIMNDTYEYVKNAGWGWNEFIEWKQLVDLEKGYMKDGAITIQASVKILKYSFN